MKFTCENHMWNPNTTYEICGVVELILKYMYWLGFAMFYVGNTVYSHVIKCDFNMKSTHTNGLLHMIHYFNGKLHMIFSFIGWIFDHMWTSFQEGGGPAKLQLWIKTYKTKCKNLTNIFTEAKLCISFNKKV